MEALLFAGNDPARCPSCWNSTEQDGEVWRHVCPLDGPLEVAWTPIEGGIRLPDLETGEFFVDVLHVGSRWRIVMTLKAVPGVYQAGWEYFGRQPQTAITAAYAWHLTDQCARGTRPAGFLRSFELTPW